jgi:N-acetylglucosaminylphosphatidylinositol deacetylase
LFGLERKKKVLIVMGTLEWLEWLDWIKGGLLVLNLVLGLVFLILALRHQPEEKESKFEPEAKNILVVIAHPDDEAMFFVPVIKTLTANRTVFLLCLSTGNYEGLGETRKRELQDSAKLLGVSKVQIEDRKELPDDPKATWNTSLISSILSDFVSKHNIQTVCNLNSFSLRI